MTNLWNKSGVPHKDWHYVDMEDLEEPYGTCQMCGHIGVRYMHYMEHEDYEGQLGVGCVCAEKMQADYVGLSPKEREKRVKSWAGKRGRWLTRKWRTSYSGNDFVNVDGFNIAIFQYKQGRKAGKWGYKISDEYDDRFGNLSYNSSNEAKIGAFEEFKRLRLLQEDGVRLR